MSVAHHGDGLLRKLLRQQQPSKYKDTITETQHRDFLTCAGNKFKFKFILKLKKVVGEKRI